MSTDHDAGNSGTWDESIAKYIDQSGAGGISAITGSLKYTNFTRKLLPLFQRILG